MVDAHGVVDYFSRVLRRGQLEPMTFQEDAAFIAVPRSELETGAVSGEDAATLFTAHEEKLSQKTKAERKPPITEPEDEPAEEPDKPLSVVISLVSVHHSGSRGGARHSGLLLLEAQLFRDGHLEPRLETASSPWIPSERLESPSVSGLPVMVGALLDFWAYSRAELGAEISQATTFAQALEISTRLFERVAGASVAEYAATQREQGEQIEYTHCYITEINRINAVGPLLDLYDFLGSQQKLPATVERVTLGWQGPRAHESTIHRNDGLFTAAMESCGSMGDGFPLTDSQRRAVHAFLDNSGSEITAVSGPPGTGKTTMLQSIVANVLTRRALNREAPPVIVGTSTNNQAVTNIISSFASVTKEEPGALDFRWLPQEEDGEASEQKMLSSLAVYCPSVPKLAEASSQYLVEQKDKSRTYTAYSDDAYIAAARNRFVISAHAYFGNSHDIIGLQTQIHDALTELESYRKKLLTLMRGEGRSHGYIELCQEVERSALLTGIAAVSVLKDCSSLEHLDQKLDVTLRYAQFWLAVHYFEAQWLLTEDFIAADERWKNTPAIMQRYWAQAAALTPCFVMTVYQLPKYFTLFGRSGDSPRFDLGRIDLLIVDEAGQVDTPLGIPAFALASRVLVVGDEKQLAPVWSIDEQTDAEVAHSAGVSATSWTTDLQPRGVTCSASSSLMRAASHASGWSYGDGAPGLFLSEHFRCHPDIIEYCNALLYDGLLHANRPAASSRLDGLSPAFLWVDVPGSVDSRQGGSRSNQVEAEVIAAWIVDNYTHFFDLYHTQETDPNRRVALEELIAVVTPFSAQARLISQEVKKAVIAAGADAGLPEKLWTKITVGTAHRLQGAERPIVLFSAVYGEDSAQAAFVDVNPELMNVAVSRAKDLFMVFAAKNRWDSGPVFGTMSEFAHRSDGVFLRGEDQGAAGTGAEGNAEVSTSRDASDVPELQTSVDAGDGVASPRQSGGPGSVLSSSAMLKGWKEAGEMRAEDAALSTPALNARLHEAGVLLGAPGAWSPSPLARVLGVLAEQRRNARGVMYESITYTPAIQEILLTLYREGKI